MNTELLEELHRHRQHHVGQLNALNLGGSIGVLGVSATVLIADKIQAANSHCLGVLIASLIAAGAVLLIVAASLHWLLHAERIRAIDTLIYEVLTGTDPFANGVKPSAKMFRALGPEWHKSYWLLGLGIACLVVAAIIVVTGRIVP